MIVSAQIAVIFAFLLVQFSIGAVQASDHATLASHHPAPLLLDASLSDLTAGLEHGDFSSYDLVSRIKEVNDTLHVVTELNPDAIKIAQDLDKERAERCVRGPLHGIPVLIKNNIGTADQMNNTAGSFALLGATLPTDSTVASKLRAAGAILLGKANLSQWANFRSTNTSNGLSAYGGQTKGAYYPSQDPCGSSSGSGVASSLGLAWASLGSETDGSLICPGNYNNIVSIKPTVGLTSRYLVIPISATQDTVGPMARTVLDAATLLSAIAGPDANDNATSQIPFGSQIPDYAASAKRGTLSGKRLGIPRNYISLYTQDDPSAPAVLAAFESALSTLRDQGAILVDSNFTLLDDPKNYSTLQQNEQTVLATEFIDGLKIYLSHLSHNPLNLHNLTQVRKFTQTFPAENYPTINTAIWDAALALNLSSTSNTVYQARQQNYAFGATGGIEASIKRDKLDAVILPTLYASTLAAVVGAPVITVPMGAYPSNTPVQRDARGVLVEVAPNIPFGLAFTGLRWSEESLVGLAYAYEQRTQWRRKIKPVIVPKTEL